MGAVVRVTGSGLGCPDWPLCHGRLLPPADFHAIVEYVHRTIAALVGVPLALLFLSAWRSQRRDRLVFRSVNLMLLLLVPQVLLGREVVLRELPPMLVAVHLAIALSIIALAVVVAATTVVRGRALGATLGAATAPDRPATPGGPAATESGRPATAGGLAATASAVAAAAGPVTTATAIGPAGPSRYPTSVVWTTVGVFFLLLTGAYMRASGASWVCPGFPLCGGQLPLGDDRLIDLHMFHRLTATVVGGAVVYQGRSLARRYSCHRGIVLWARGAAALAVIQFAIGIAQVSVAPLPLFQILHLAFGTATWAAIVVVATLVYHATRPVGRPAGGVEAAREPARAAPHWAAYLSLTKPRIISLLLVTALGGMMLAADGLPPLPIVLFTLLGGALSAGGANAINCYIDRDIDGMMGRTTLRPIPAGLVRPERALLFGIALTVASLAVFGLLVNPLAVPLAVDTK